jgi:uncharacterized protein YqhQ
MNAKENTTDSSGGSLRLGGMALQNGLLLHSRQHWSAAIRRPDGSIEVASGRKRGSLQRAGSRLPLARGILRLADALLVLPQVKAKLKDAQLPLEAPRVVVTMALSAFATAGVRRMGPTRGVVGRELATAVLALAPAVVALKNSSIAQYHGAEHKSIGEYERRLRGEEPRDAPKEHERCGSNLVGPLLLTNALANAALRRGGRATPGRTLLAGLVGIGSAMEIFGWMSRNQDSPVARALSRPGHSLQKLFTTEEPSPEQMQVAYAALNEILRLEGVEVLEEEASTGI